MELTYLFRIPTFPVVLSIDGVFIGAKTSEELTIELGKFLVPNEKALMAFDEQIEPLFETVYVNEKINTLASLRDTLLPKLVFGELCIPDAEKFVEEAGI